MSNFSTQISEANIHSITINTPWFYNIHMLIFSVQFQKIHQVHFTLVIIKRADNLILSACLRMMGGSIYQVLNTEICNLCTPDSRMDTQGTEEYGKLYHDEAHFFVSNF